MKRFSYALPLLLTFACGDDVSVIVVDVEITGYRVEEFLHGVVSIFDLVLPADRTAVMKRAEGAFARDEPFEVEYRLQGKNGRVHWNPLRLYRDPRGAQGKGLAGRSGPRPPTLESSNEHQVQRHFISGAAGCRGDLFGRRSQRSRPTWRRRRGRSVRACSGSQ